MDVVISEKPISPAFTKKSPYPFGLSEEQVIRLIYFFGARKSAQKAAAGQFRTGATDFTSLEERIFKDITSWFGYVWKSDIEKKRVFRAVIVNFKRILDFLKGNPAYITMGIYQALTTAGYKNPLQQVLLVAGEGGKLSLRVNSSGRTVVPIGKLETEMWNFQSMTFDKMKMIVQSIEQTDVEKASLGAKSKALRDLYSVIHMARLSNKVPNLTLMNINIGSSGSKEKVLAYSAYINKNRESN